MADRGTSSGYVVQPLITDWTATANIIAELNRSIELNRPRIQEMSVFSGDAKKFECTAFGAIHALCVMMSTLTMQMDGEDE